MIDITYSKAILNLLFAKSASGSASGSPSKEHTQLVMSGVPINGVTSQEALDAAELFTDTATEKQTKAQLRNQYQAWKDLVNRCTFWMTEDRAAVTKQYEFGEATVTVQGVGWKIVRNPSASGIVEYPTTRYLALFTTMPKADGTGFVEPFLYNDDNIPTTTYQRINLDSGYFAGKPIMKKAELDTENGGATTSNGVTIYYPEIVEVDWGTLVGFGIFANQEPTEGEKPYLWGALSNTDTVFAETEHVPLFRKDNFTLSIL